MSDETTMHLERQAIRMLVRLRDDFQGMRKRTDNRLGRKADGANQNVAERQIRVEDYALFAGVADNARDQEKMLEKALLERLRLFPVYTEYLVHIKGVGPVSAGWIISEFDIHIATTVSKMWQFAGLSPGLVRGRKAIKDAKGVWHYETTDILIRGDRLAPGFVAPFNKRLRVALVGVMADGFIKQQNDYALDFYYPYKHRLEQEANKANAGDKAWSEVSKGHRDSAAKRYMVKMFLRDLYVAWRTLEGLPVRPPYQDEYLGHTTERAAMLV